MSIEYPRMMFGEGGATRTVLSLEEEKDLGAGWSREPSDEHRAAPRMMIPAAPSNVPLTEAHIPQLVDAIVDKVVAALMAASPPKPKKET